MGFDPVIKPFGITVKKAVTSKSKQIKGNYGYLKIIMHWGIKRVKGNGVLACATVMIGK